MIYVLTCLYNFIKDHLLQNVNYFEAKNCNFIIPFDRSYNLLLDNYLVISIKISRKRDVIADAILVDYTSYLIPKDFVIYNNIYFI